MLYLSVRSTLMFSYLNDVVMYCIWRQREIYSLFQYITHLSKMASILGDIS